MSVSTFRRRSYLLSASVLTLAFGASAPIARSAFAQVLPSGGEVVAGAASITGTSNTLTVRQTTDKAIINWNSFSIGQGSSVRFENGQGATLNRVTGSQATSIDGLLSGTGSVYLINKNGIIIGREGVVDVGGSFVATTHDISNEKFLSGGDLMLSGDSEAPIVNYGKIGSLGGDVALVAAKVENRGQIEAAQGTAGLLAGYQVLLRDRALDEGKFAIVLGGATPLSPTRACCVPRKRNCARRAATSTPLRAIPPESSMPRAW